MDALEIRQSRVVELYFNPKVLELLIKKVGVDEKGGDEKGGRCDSSAGDIAGLLHSLAATPTGGCK